MCPVFGIQKRARTQPARQRGVRRGRLVDGTVSRLAPASGFCWPISPEVPLQGNSCKTQPVGLNSADGFRRRLAPSWKRVWGLVLVFLGERNLGAGGLYTPPFSLKNETSLMLAASAEIHTQLAVAALPIRKIICCAVLQRGRGQKTTRLQAISSLAFGGAA